MYDIIATNKLSKRTKFSQLISTSFVKFFTPPKSPPIP